MTAIQASGEPAPTTGADLSHDSSIAVSGLNRLLEQVERRCIQCRICVHECAFLQRYGDPKFLAQSYDSTDPYSHKQPFECHLCGLCTAVCPHSVNPAGMFLAMRRQAVTSGQTDLSRYKALRSYEKRGTSKSFSWYSLPEGCDTVFFPGCALSGSRPDETYQVFKTLKEKIATIGIVLDCCTKPSHDLGDQQHFDNMFSEMTSYLVVHGIKNILVACPNCQTIFTQYANALNTRTIYEVLDEITDTTHPPGQTVSIHDPCVTRFQETTQTAVRSLLQKRGFSIKEPLHSRRKTLCCGEGAGVTRVAPKFSSNWAAKRLSETEGERLVSYCAACTARFSKHARSHHLLDLMFTPETALTAGRPEAKAPRTYFNRLRLKQRLRRETPSGASVRERTLLQRPQASREALSRLALLTFLILMLIGFRIGGGLELFQQDRLQALLASYGIMAPLAYMLLYAIAPTLFLPGLPIGIVGGILFGPILGVVYTSISATTGACLAFLISRYLARDLIMRQLKAPRWKTLNAQAEHNGWKLVALTRLVPLFPFNLLNYAFGLTNIRFSHYCLATFIFMLPGTIACITLSSSLNDLLAGHLTPPFFIGLALTATLVCAPLLYRRLKRRSR